MNRLLARPRPRRTPPGGADLLFDLLGRRPISLDTPELQRFVAGKRVLVTGAGGSIGSELARQCARFCPDRLVLVERAEGALFEIDRELRERWIGVDVRPTVADINDRPRMTRVFAEHRPQIVFHAAAHKHVPMMESNPGEAVKNNALGTHAVVEQSIEHDVDSFVLISTDKAVNPSSVMGATKRVAEMITQAANERSDHTRAVAVRFGNVIGSSGSVVPIFQRQIEAGGPVTVTHAEMRRYFMTIPEASQLVMQAAAIGRGGELFLLDMGEPVKILDLAERLIRINGLEPGKDIEIRITGVRPGEKLFEELAYESEQTAESGHDRIRVWRSAPPTIGQVQEMIERLTDVIDADPHVVRSALAAVVPEYDAGQATALRLVA